MMGAERSSAALPFLRGDLRRLAVAVVEVDVTMDGKEEDEAAVDDAAGSDVVTTEGCEGLTVAEAGDDSELDRAAAVDDTDEDDVE